MFSFIKYIQGLFEKLKKNKGLWFTTITTVSVIGIIVSMYIITTMTSNVSQKVYASMAKDYKNRLDSYTFGKKSEFKKIIIGIYENKPLLEFIAQNNAEQIKVFQTKINDSLKQNGINNYAIDFYSTVGENKVFRNSINSAINSKNSVYGIDVTPKGVFNTYIQPLVNDDGVYGIIEVKESIHNYRKFFEAIDDEYVFLLDKKILPQISIEHKVGKYREMNENYTLAQTFYDTKFASTITEISDEKFEMLKNKEYLIDGVYYRTYHKVRDVNGVNVGVMIMGELIDKESGFVNLADSMTKTVTMVALGLIISIILFMF